MKNIFLPAISIMNKLRYLQKFMLMSLSIFMLTVGILYLLLSNLNTQIEFNSKEVLGIQYINPLKDMLFEMQKYRYKSFSGKLKSSVKINELENKIDKADEKLNTTLKVGKDWELIKQNWANAENNTDKQTEVINRIITLISHINDTSNLVLDPDLDTYYLMDAYSLKLPNILEKISLVKKSGIENIKLNKANVKELIQLQTLIEETNGLLKSGLDVIYGFNPSTKNYLNKPFNQAYSDNIKLLEVLNNLVEGKKVTATAFDATMDAALNSNKLLYNADSVKIEELINIRVKKYSDQIPVSIAFTLLAVGIIAYFFMGFYFSVSDSMSIILDRVNKVANGDLNVTIKVNTHDEMNDFSISLNFAINRIKEMVLGVAKTAEQINIELVKSEEAVKHSSVGAEQTSISIMQLAMGAQTQAQSAGEGANRVNHIDNAIKNISSNIETVLAMSQVTENSTEECNQ
ncbi:MAG: hypothetical protein WCK67_08155 [bacterium]